MQVPQQLWRTAERAFAAGRFEDAEAVFEEILSIDPRSADAHAHIGYVRQRSGQPAKAELGYREAIRINADHVFALANLSALLVGEGRAKEGIALLERALRLQPGHAALWKNLSAMHISIGDHANARRALDRALELAPRDIDARLESLGLFMHDGKWAEALRYATELITEVEARQRNRCYFIATLAAAKLSEWKLLSRLEAEFLPLLANEANGVTAIQAAFLIDEPKLLHVLALKNAAEFTEVHRAPGSPRAHEGPIRVGYLSADFREHPVAHMLIEVLRNHDRSAVEPILLRTWHRDGSVVASALEGLAPMVELSGRTGAEAAKLIADARIDVLVDLGGSTEGGRPDIVAQRPAPVQMLWLGCAVTTGLSCYDAFILDEWTAPHSGPLHCSEPIVRLPVCFHPISTGCVGPLPDSPRSAFGFPPQSPVAAVLVPAERVRSAFIEPLGRWMAESEDLHLLVRAQPDRRKGVEEWFGERGIGSGRILFTERLERREDYLRMLSHVDLIMDPFPYGGHSTVGEAIRLGVPVLTRTGSSIHCRIAGSMLHQAGLGDLVATTTDEYWRLAKELFSNPILRTEWKRRFSEAALRLSVNDPNIRLTQELESAFRVLLLKSAVP